jgi:hypothetical protein
VLPCPSQVVHVDDPWRLEQVRAHLRQVDPLRRGLQQHVDGLAQQPHGARHDRCGDEHRHHRVGPGEAGEADHERRHHDRERPEQVGQHLEVGRADVEVVPAGTGEQGERDAVGRHADEGDDQHRAGLDVGRHS